MTTTVLNEIDIDQIDEEIKMEMKLNAILAIKTDLLKSLVGKVERSVSKKTTQEILKFIYFEIREDKITLRAANSDFTIEAWEKQNEDCSNFKLTGGKPGSVCFLAEKMIPIVKRLSAKNTEIKVEANNAIFKSGRANFELNGIDGSEFPHTPETSDSLQVINIHSSFLSRAYDRTIYAASTRETRPILTGVHHVLDGSELTCYATDSYRLAKHVVELEEEVSEKYSTTIPVTVLSEVKKHLDQEEKEITVEFQNSLVVYRFCNVVFYARLLSDKYPNVENLIFNPDISEGPSFVANAGKLKVLLNNASIYEDDRYVLLKIIPGLNQLRATANEEEIGSYQEDLSLSEGSGDGFLLALNGAYLKEALMKYSNEDHIKFNFPQANEEIPSGLKPFILRLHKGRGDSLDLLVPVRTQADYDKEVIIEDFQDISDSDFNPFEASFEEIN